MKMMTKDSLTKKLRYVRILILLYIVLQLSLRPLYMANWWLESAPFREKTESQWKDFQCGTRFDQQFVDLNTVFSNSSSGGKYENKNCLSAQKIAIIVPYRNRSEHLQKFLKHMHPFLMTQNAVSYRIYVVEQLDNVPFNRGALMNVGFQEASKLEPDTSCFVFHDVDIFPVDFRQHYTCSNHPIHLCSYIDKFRYVLLYKDIFGGVISLKNDHFSDVNGFSNMYFGWGGEDDDLFKRIRSKHSVIERYSSEVGKCHMLEHSHNYVESNDRVEILTGTLGRMRYDGLTSLHKIYSFLQVENHRLYTKVKVKFIYNQP